MVSVRNELEAVASESRLQSFKLISSEAENGVLWCSTWPLTAVLDDCPFLRWLKEQGDSICLTVDECGVVELLQRDEVGLVWMHLESHLVHAEFGLCPEVDELHVVKFDCCTPGGNRNDTVWW